MKKITRREFIVSSSMIVGGTVGGVTFCSDVLSPPKVQAARVDFPESSCGAKKQTGKKILVAYASFCGTTGGVAEAIGQVLCERGATVDVRLVKNVKNIKTYDAAVIGSAVRSSSWWPEAIEFVERNRETLAHIPVAYFLTCLALYKDNEGSRRVARSYMNPLLDVVPDVKPVDMGFFAGALQYEKMNMIYRMIMKSKMKKQGVPEGDFRDWKAIRAWAAIVFSPLLGLSSDLRSKAPEEVNEETGSRLAS